MLQQLSVQAEPSEAATMATWLLEHYLKASRTDVLLNNNITVPKSALRQLARAVTRLNQHEPIQYVLEETFFYGRKLKVSPDVLIPRRETEELVAWVKEENLAPGMRVLDIGTGSGCIAVTLSLEMSHPCVHALDISSAAIRVATENAALHQTKVTFQVADVLREELTIPSPFDILVSNPPYVRRSEAANMSARVLSYEPDEALFVDNQQPLLFYERMIDGCQRDGWLTRGGTVYWEINEELGDKLVHLLRERCFKEVCLRRDMQGKPRFITGKLAE